MQISTLTRLRALRLNGHFQHVVVSSRGRLSYPIRTSTVDLPTSQPKVVESVNWDVRILYDGECPLCLKEIGMLKNKDKGQNKISFVNIATEEYEPDENGGVTYGQAMGRIHGVLPDGRVIEGIEVFRRCYTAVGLGWVYAMTSLKPIEWVVNAVYDVWARYRLPLTGRMQEGIDSMRYWNREPQDCNSSNFCELTWDVDDDGNLEPTEAESP